MRVRARTHTPTHTTHTHTHTTQVCRGVFPSSLLDEWDTWDTENESENVRPDLFGDDQLFIVFQFEYGGADFESIEFGSVEEAASMLRQVCFRVSFSMLLKNLSLFIAVDHLKFLSLSA
jgi:hypothetical protein